MTLAKSYSPAQIEQDWYQKWESSGHFAPSGEGTPYCIMIPPPNVTGSLHMGHAFQDTIMDALTRYHRMKGDNTLWQPGTDHAGIATQMVVERLINQEGKTRHDYGRDAFIDRVWDWKKESGGTITQQMRRMGASVDWENERFTMDEGLSDAVRAVFVRLYDMGIIYRGKRLVNWDPVLHTALSDLEVESVEEQGHMWHINYPLVDGEGSLTVATTRPETLLGDAAIAVHPDDERYAAIVGKFAVLPLTGRQIPIIADEYVDPEFGTGCVKITPAHDFNDYQVWKRHMDSPAMQAQSNGGLINVLTDNAAIRENSSEEGDLIPTSYVGLDRYDCRKLIVSNLETAGLLEKIEPHSLKVPKGDRSGAVVEPYLTDQWYVDLTKDKQEDGRIGGKAFITEPSLEVVRNGKVKFVPKSWENTYFQWLENIEDWCISRQIWWGHRIPAWYDDDDKVYVGDSEEQVRKKYSLDASINLRQDQDVLDTWFSSALWPFSTLGWPDQTDRLKTFYPTSVLVTGFDIIFFWVARMIMAGVSFMEEVPFHEVYITGLVRDQYGQKMSKSKGNVLDPIDLIDGIELDALLEKRTKGMMQPQLKDKITKQTLESFPDGIPAFGTDALRFTFTALATNGRDINFAWGRIEGNRNFCNKIWNAARFVLMNTEEQDCAADHDNYQLSAVDQWIISRLQHTELEVTRAFEEYRFDRAASAMYDFMWNEYCDWYLELTKPVLNGDYSEAEKVGTRRTLVRVLEATMRLMHPVMPFITEEIWQKVAPLAGKQGETIMIAPFPICEESQINSEAEEQIKWVQDLILGVRQIRGEMNISPGKPLPVMLNNANQSDQTWAKAHGQLIKFVGRIESIEIIENDTDTPESAVALVNEMKVMIPLAGLIDKEAEIERLTREIEKSEANLMRTRGKLTNPSFVDKAPEAVVAKEKEKLAQGDAAVANLREQLEKIQSM
ncbi:MAG: valyl-tRNA synthetase [Parvicella sp.]|jgi:valyl-tRNA synthetase